MYLAGSAYSAGRELINFILLFWTVPATDMIQYSRYSQQPSAGRTGDTVPPSFVIPSFRGSLTGSPKIQTHTHTQSAIYRCTEIKFSLFSLNPDPSEHVFGFLLVVNSLCEPVRAASNSCHNVDIFDQVGNKQYTIIDRIYAILWTITYRVWLWLLLHYGMSRVALLFLHLLSRLAMGPTSSTKSALTQKHTIVMCTI